MSFFSLTKKADYGLVLVSELAKAGGNVVSTKSLAEKKRLPKAFLAAIGKDLVGAGVIASKEGKNGGYFLTADPAKVKVMEVIEALEGKIAPVACVIEDHGCPVGEVCSQKSFMNRLSGDIQMMLSKYTVADLL